MASILSSTSNYAVSGRRIIVCAAAVLAVAATLNLGGCSTPPATFASADEAVNSLVGALRSENTVELKRILGSDSDEILFSGDDVADTNGRADFLKLYDEKHQLKAEGEDKGVLTLEVGATEWPLPIPVVEGEKGWFFDTEAGLDELLSRRIGRNELSTIQVCLEVADAQREYATADFNGDGWREYAQKFMSDAGKKNGLYWPIAPGAPESPLGELVASASGEGYKASSSPQPFHGYYYRILTEQGPAAPGGSLNYVGQGHMIGGFGVVAWPADYGNSGLKTFITSHHGVLYERDLGDDTDRTARNMKAFNPERGWEKADTTEK